SLFYETDNSGWRFTIGKRLIGPGGSYTPQFTILDNGKVGIGTISPATTLHVAVMSQSTPTLAPNIRMLSNWVPAASDLAAGTVVVLDPSEPNRVMASLRPYDSRIAGVVSARPGLLIGEAGEGKVKVSTTGRVEVRTDARSHPIQIG